MERLSIFDIYKIGVGPSSSHTLGPWKAANRFALALMDQNILYLKIELYGSLSKTGKGHGTDIAILLGLQGHDAETFLTNTIEPVMQSIHQSKKIEVNGFEINFDPKTDIIFHNHALPFHPNGLKFSAFNEEGIAYEETYYSIGGGFIIKENEAHDHKKQILLPYPIDKGEDLLNHTFSAKLTIPEIVFQNELIFNPSSFIKKRILHIWDTMLDCMYRGCHTDGILPGGLNVKRRAKKLNDLLLKEKKAHHREEWLALVKESGKDFNSINNWVSCFALAVNEENASLGRIVTSPTNGAAGVIPAVLMYHFCFGDYKGDQDIIDFMLTSGEVGCIFKKGATISAAMGGCQAEIGVSSAMAAAGLTILYGGSANQALMAAEIAMEHHLGMTCDPIGGLVQIPCIERNAMGAIKAITACNLAITGNPGDAIVHFDIVVKTMWDTALDMNHKYKETAEGGLAMSIPVILADC